MKGNLRIKRTFPVGVTLRVSSGTKDRKLYKRLMDALEKCQERPEYLRAVRDGRMGPLDLYDLIDRKGIDGLPRLEGRELLEPAFERFLATATTRRGTNLSDKTVSTYRSSLNRLLTFGPTNPTVGDLPRMLKQAREAMPATMFNMCRAVAQTFVVRALGRYTETYNKCGNVEPRAHTARKGNPQTPEDARRIAEGLPHPMGAMWWTLCTTGMSGGSYGPYFRNQFDIEPDRIAIHGTKREGRERVVPRVCTPIRPARPYNAFRAALEAFGVKPNDGRHTYAAWMEHAGIAKGRRRRYMGHGTEDITDHYGDGFKMDGFLADDRARLLDFIGSEPGLVTLKVG
jgi:integrase